MRSLHFLSPWEKLHHAEPHYTDLRVFGCACFPWLRPYTCNKLEPRSKQCVFLGYNTTQKGYKCLDPATSHLYVSHHAVFDKSFSPFTTFFPNSFLSNPAWTSILSHWLPSMTTSSPIPQPDTHVSSSSSSSSPSPNTLVSLPIRAPSVVISPFTFPQSVEAPHHFTLPTHPSSLATPTSTLATPLPSVTPAPTTITTVIPITPQHPSTLPNNTAHSMVSRSKSSIFFFKKAYLSTKHPPLLPPHSYYHLTTPISFTESSKSNEWGQAMAEEFSALQQ